MRKAATGRKLLVDVGNTLGLKLVNPGRIVKGLSDNFFSVIDLA